MNKTLYYVKDVDIRTVLDYSSDMLQDLRGSVDSTMKTIGGLMDGNLQQDLRSAMIAAELIAGLRDKVDNCIANIVVDLIHCDNPPAINALSRTVGLSVTKIKTIDAHAEPYPSDDDGDD